MQNAVRSNSAKGISHSTAQAPSQLLEYSGCRTVLLVLPRGGCLPNCSGTIHATRRATVKTVAPRTTCCQGMLHAVCPEILPCSYRVLWLKFIAVGAVAAVKLLLAWRCACAMLQSQQWHCTCTMLLLLVS